jgi:hypothetical protein
MLKGHFHEEVVEIISLYNRFGPTLFKFLKSSVKKLRLFMWGRSRCKMGGSPDLHEFAAARTQNLYVRRSSVLYSLSVRLMHAQCVSV